MPTPSHTAFKALEKSPALALGGGGFFKGLPAAAHFCWQEGAEAGGGQAVNPLGSHGGLA